MRVALWRALHAQIDSPPQVLKDEIGLRLVAPGDDWRQRPDMDPTFTRPFRASIVARARFIEDLVLREVERGVGQYVILRHVAALARGSTLAMTFMLPIDLVDPDLRPSLERAVQGARSGGTPFLSMFTPEQMLALAREAGFKEARHVSSVALTERYFAGRPDGLRPPTAGEEMLVAEV